jgi:hypothetical protein
MKYISDHIVIEELDKNNSSGCKLVKDKIDKMNGLELSDIRKICELVQFLKISEDIDIYLYYDWYRHLREE